MIKDKNIKMSTVLSFFLSSVVLIVYTSVFIITSNLGSSIAINELENVHKKSINLIAKNQLLKNIKTLQSKTTIVDADDFKILLDGSVDGGIIDNKIEYILKDVHLVFISKDDKVVNAISDITIFDKAYLSNQILKKHKKDSGMVEVLANGVPVVVSYAYKEIKDTKMFLVKIINLDIALSKNITAKTPYKKNTAILNRDELITADIHKNSFEYALLKRYIEEEERIIMDGEIIVLKDQFKIDDVTFLHISFIKFANIGNMKSLYVKKFLLYLIFVGAFLYVLHLLIDMFVSKKLSWVQSGKDNGCDIYELNVVKENIKYLKKEFNEVADKLNILKMGTSGLLEWNLIDNSVILSKEMKKFLGYESGEILKYYHIENRIHKDDIYYVNDAIYEHCNKGNGYYEIAYRIKNHNENYVWVLERGGAIFNEKGKPIKCIGMFIDITKQKTLEQKLHKLNTALKKENLEKEKEIISKSRILVQQSKLASMGEMIGSIAHQWRQPLNIISLSMMELENDFRTNALTEGAFDKFLNTANSNIEFMSNTIDDFRNFYKPDKNKDLFKVFHCILELKDMFEIQFKKFDIDIAINNHQDYYSLGFKNEFKQVILNILNNAKEAILIKKKAIADKGYRGKINIKLYKDEEYGVMEIEDNGTGIKNENIDKIFEPYFTTKFEDKGTGIGLYMSKNIIEKHMSGNIFAKNNKGDGATFIIKTLLVDKN